MTERWMTFTEESNALDYLERAAQFIREATADDHAWKWVVISLHGAIYGFAICACKGTDHHAVTYQTKRGERKLISFEKALEACQDPQEMKMTYFSKPLVLSADQKAAIAKLQKTFRNKFEHYIPTSWHIEIHDLPTMAIHCLEVLRFLALETGNYTHLTRKQSKHIRALVSGATRLLRSMPLHKEFASLSPRGTSGERAGERGN